jgi:predicted nucleotide-binding protein (sugar kinase/HSP70/actin superfamily)
LEELTVPYRVGIPNTLFYYLYFPVWETFFENIGVEVVTSGNTNKKTLDYGVKEALADACVPIKIYFGHILDLKEKLVDYIFVPRIVCLNGQTTYCPKFLGLPDMIRSMLTDIPPLIDVRVDVRESYNALFKAFYEVGNVFNARSRVILQSYWKAMRIWKKFVSLLQTGRQPIEAMKILKNGKRFVFPKDSADLTFAILGYPYLIYDQFISVGLLNKLSKMNIKAITQENLPAKSILREPNNLDKRLFWTFSDLVYKATQFLLKNRNIDGIIHVSAFGCGPDAILDRLMEMLIRKNSNIPFMSLCIDEHGGEAGLTTRLEAFADMVRRQKGGLAHA